MGHFHKIEKLFLKLYILQPKNLKNLKNKMKRSELFHKLSQEEVILRKKLNDLLRLYHNNKKCVVNFQIDGVSEIESLQLIEYAIQMDCLTVIHQNNRYDDVIDIENIDDLVPKHKIASIMYDNEFDTMEKIYDTNVYDIMYRVKNKTDESFRIVIEVDM